MAAASAKRTRSPTAPARNTPPPARIAGRSAASRSATASTASAAVGAGRGGTAGGRKCVSVKSASAFNTSVGTASNTGPGRPLIGAADRLVRDLRQALGAPDFHCPLDDVGEKGRQFDLLERLFVTVRRFDLADQGDQRRAVLIGGVQGNRHVRAAHAARAHRQRGGTRQLADRFRHKARATLVPCRHEADCRVVVERVQHREETFPRHREGKPHPLAPQLLHKCPCAAHPRHVPPPVISCTLLVCGMSIRDRRPLSPDAGSDLLPGPSPWGRAARGTKCTHRGTRRQSLA